MVANRLGISNLARAMFALFLLVICGSASAQVFYDNEYIWSNTDPTLNVRRSEHFRFVWGNGQNPDTSSEYNSVTEALIQGNLQAFEHEWHATFDAPPGGVGFRQANESINATYRDGRFYRTNLTLNNTGIYAGGGWGTLDDYGFPWFAVNPAGLHYDPQPDASFHEYLHTVVINAAGFNNTPWDGMWHECTIDWLGVPSYWYAGMGGYAIQHNFTLPNGRAYYDAWLWDEILYEDPRYGTDFITKLWTQANGSSGEYMFDAIVRLHPAGEPDPTNSIKDLLGMMAARNVTWDYQGKQYYRLTTGYTLDGSPSNDRLRRGTSELVAQPGNPGWYRTPFQHAPCQGGYDICPIALTGKTTGGYSVSIDFQPLWDSVRKSDWRACFVAVNTGGEARYSNMWNSGINTITLSADENILYLVVSATPDFQAFNGFNGPLMTDAPTAPQAYRVAFVNTAATPYLIIPNLPNVAHTHHANGGGFKANTATVDATAYVGPNAAVYDTAKVLGNARIEDYAVVYSTAQVRDNAIVSGHAIVRDSAQVYGYAKVRDWAMVNSRSKVYENGRVIEHGYISDDTLIHGDAVIKGCTWEFNPASGDYPNVSGCAIKDADCSNYADMDHGVLMGWVWGANQDRANALTDNAYLYCGYDFDKTSPNYALDEYGITYGYLIGSPSIVNGGATNRGSVLFLNGTSQYIELMNGVSDFDDCSFALWIKWNGAADEKVFSFGDGANKYVTLTPSDAGGNLKFAITTTGVAGEQTLTAAALPANTWKHVTVTLSGDTGTMYVNGVQVAANASMTLNPDDCNGANISGAGNLNFLCKGNAGNYFTGQIDDFRIYCKALTTTEITALQTLAGGTVTTTTDTTAPTPNAATWLVAPKVNNATSVTMSATKGADASNYIQYYFTCTSGGGHDSGWTSSNKYFDSALTPGTTYAYTVKMRDKAGNTTTASSALSVTLPADTTAPTPSVATFLLPPKGISTTAIAMTATMGVDESPLVEYNFNRVLLPGGTILASSGWQTNPTWTDTSLTSGTTYSYTVQMRDAYSNTGTVSAVSSAPARDDTPPVRYTYGEWCSMPWATIDNKVAMRARSITGGHILSCNIANETVEYYFHCTSGGGPDSGWVSTSLWTSPSAVADGAYSYQFKIRDKSAQWNETPYSSIQTAVVGPTTGYHSYALNSLVTVPDEYLVTFSGTIMRVNTDNYIVKDLLSGNWIKVKPHAATEPTYVLKNYTIKGHMFTLSGARLVTTATLTFLSNPATYTISGKVTNSSGVGISGATVYFSDAANASVNYIVTATTDASGNYSKALPNPSTWYICAGAGAYNTSADLIRAVNGANISNVNFTLESSAKISGKVTKRSDGTAISGASVYFSTSPNAFSSPLFTATTDALGNYNQPVPIGTWYVCASGAAYYPSADKTAVVTGVDVTGIDLTLASNTRNIPRTADLLFSCVTDILPASGTIATWATYLPAGGTLTKMNTPTVDIINGIKWEKNLYADYDGFDLGTYSAAIPINGATIVVAVKPTRSADSGNWRSVVDIFYDRLVLGLQNNTGYVNVRRNGSLDVGSTAIPDGQITILSLVVQTDGKYKVYANGTEVMSRTSTSDMSATGPGLVPSVAGAYANHINVGRNNPDSWPTFNGNIGDIFVYKVTLTDPERLQLETDLYNKFMSYFITAATPTGGTISPSGVTQVSYKTNQTYTITPNTGYTIANVVADGVSKGAVSTYTFSNVIANHTISAAFNQIKYTITASAQTGGAISPSGAVLVNHGANQTFTFTPNASYAVSDIIVDGISCMPASSYTFTNVTAPHTISVKFAKLTGMNNKSAVTYNKAQGRAVKVWGKVITIAGDNLSFTISDGYSTQLTVFANGTQLPSGFAANKYGVITGWLIKNGANNEVYAQTITVQ
ncbi:MAG: DUF6055 domain-containing protein [Armatimonadetes bacterium]|nr:DUF6055 domain-containing protein [Armatimonadota bacterium]